MIVLLSSLIDNTKVQAFPTAVNDKHNGILPHHLLPYFILLRS